MGRLIIDPKGLSYTVNVYPATTDTASAVILDSAGELIEFPETVAAKVIYTLPSSGTFRVSAVRHGVECLAAVVDAARSVTEVLPDPLIAAARGALLALPLAPIEIEGVRDDPEEALAALLAGLATLGLITDSTTET